MYTVHNAEGRYVARAATRAGAHRATRRARHLGASVNRALSGWQDWAKFEKRPGFIEWAEPPPSDPSESRYAVIQDRHIIVWAEVSPNPDVSMRTSGGAFYDDMPGGAVQAAKAAAMRHKAKMRALIGDSNRAGTSMKLMGYRVKVQKHQGWPAQWFTEPQVTFRGNLSDREGDGYVYVRPYAEWVAKKSGGKIVPAYFQDRDNRAEQGTSRVPGGKMLRRRRHRATRRADRDRSGDGTARGQDVPAAVAETILAQLGGAGRLRAMIGAHTFVGGENRIHFRWRLRAKNGANAITITLMPSDTYKVEFHSVRGSTVRLKGSFDDIYAEDLISLFERETGLYLRM